jgi:polyisoprenoid-binding protein YceI
MKQHAITHLMIGLTLCTALSARAAVEVYTIDPDHSWVGFSVRHVFTKVPGFFSKVKGAFTVDRDNLENSKAEGVIDVASITTSAPLRDEHLRSDKFFDATKYPTMTFKSKNWKKSTEEPDIYMVTGDLTIRAVTKEIILKVKSLGFGPGMQETSVSGWELSTMLDRRDYGITAAQGPIGNKVEVTINIEAILQKPPAPKIVPPQ